MWYVAASVDHALVTHFDPSSCVGSEALELREINEKQKEASEVAWNTRASLAFTNSAFFDIRHFLSDFMPLFVGRFAKSLAGDASFAKRILLHNLTTHLQYRLLESATAQ